MEYIIDKIFIEEILSIKAPKVEKEDILGIYRYGSFLYGTANEDSDLDYIIVLKDNSAIFEEKEYIQIESKTLDLHILSKSYYIKILEEHNIMALEMYFQEDPIMKCKVDFKVDLPKLRQSISSIVSHSWVKSKKKMELPDEDSYIGLKSLFHSFRILNFGISIAKYNRINYRSERLFWEDLLMEWEIDKSWDFYFTKYKKVHNSLNTEFRKLAPKK